MTNLDQLIESLKRIHDTDRHLNNKTILSALIQLAGEVKKLKEKTEDPSFVLSQDTMSL